MNMLHKNPQLQRLKPVSRPLKIKRPLVKKNTPEWTTKMLVWLLRHSVPNLIIERSPLLNWQLTMTGSRSNLTKWYLLQKTNQRMQLKEKPLNSIEKSLPHKWVRSKVKSIQRINCKNLSNKSLATREQDSQNHKTSSNRLKRSRLLLIWRTKMMPIKLWRQPMINWRLTLQLSLLRTLLEPSLI